MPLVTAEVVGIGDELLNGAVVNANAAFISRALQDLGIVVTRHLALPDQEDLLEEGLAESMSCVPLVIATGGLGPTLDDKTKQVAAKLFDCELELDPEVLEALKKRYGDHASLIDQSTLPRKALKLQNRLGTASGLVLINAHSTLILLPGVPLEMEVLMEEQVIPYLKRAFVLSPPDERLKLHFFSLFESSVDPTLRELQERWPDLKMGIYPHNGLLTVSLQGSKESLEDAQEKLRLHYGRHEYFAADGRIETAVQELLVKKGKTLSIAESCTGGAISARMTSIPGASRCFIGSIVSYANPVKESLLEVASSVLQEKGAVSPEVAKLMAEGCARVLGTDYAVAVTGIAGPDGGTPEKPVGTVYLALHERHSGKTDVMPVKTRGSRASIIDRASNFALGELYQFVQLN
jgi:nicotinamide-nucleotide amidase